MQPIDKFVGIHLHHSPQQDKNVFVQPMGPGSIIVGMRFDPLTIQEFKQWKSFNARAYFLLVNVHNGTISAIEIRCIPEDHAPPPQDTRTILPVEFDHVSIFGHADTIVLSWQSVHFTCWTRMMRFLHGIAELNEPSNGQTYTASSQTA